MADAISADVVIVGSGISGAMLAAGLAKAGVKVAVLEAGDQVRPCDGREHLLECRHQGARVRLSADSPGHASGLERPHLLVSPGRSRQFRQHLHQGGGGHHLALARHLPAPGSGDFQLRTLYGQGIDWPIAYADLEPFYGAAEAAIGVSGDSASDLGAPRSTPYPMPEIPQTYLDKAYAKALAGTIMMSARRRRAAIRSIAGLVRPAAAMQAAFRSARFRPSMMPPSISIRRSPPVPCCMPGRPPSLSRPAPTAG